MYVLLIKIKKRSSFWGFWIKKDNFLRKPLPEQRAECRIPACGRQACLRAIGIMAGRFSKKGGKRNNEIKKKSPVYDWTLLNTTCKINTIISLKQVF